jgi:DNA-binding transcriptional LysR family regulator
LIGPSFLSAALTYSADAALWHAEHNGCLTFALSCQVADAVKAGRLRIVLESFEPPTLPIHFVYPSSRLLSARVRTFVELAAATCDWRF